MNDEIDYKAESIYMIATSDIKRYQIASDREPFKSEVCFSDETTVKVPKYMIVQLTDAGLVEFFSQILIVSEEEKEYGVGVYFTMNAEHTSTQIISEHDFVYCYDNNYDEEYLTKLGTAFLKFAAKGQYAKANALPRKEIKLNKMFN